MKIRSHRDLETYQIAFKSAMEIFELTKKFPKEEKFSLTDQIRRSSRSVCANLAEAFRKRRYPKSFAAKLSDSEGEAAETQVWLEFSLECGYMEKATYERLFEVYEQVIGKLVNMALNPEKWCY
jgi:four helix bundle protein